MRVHFCVALVAVSCLALMAQPAAAGSEVLSTTCSILLQIWVWVRGAVYVLAAMGLAFMSFQASILGRFSMGRLVTWGGALFMLSMVPLILAYLSDGSARMTCP